MLKNEIEFNHFLSGLGTITLRYSRNPNFEIYLGAKSEKLTKSWQQFHKNQHFRHLFVRIYA